MKSMTVKMTSVFPACKSVVYKKPLRLKTPQNDAHTDELIALIEQAFIDKETGVSLYSGQGLRSSDIRYEAYG